MQNPTPFHYAFKVKDLESTKKFYQDVLGCEMGRSTEHWLDFNFFGHQLSAHVSDQIPELDYGGEADGIKVPIPHFGAIVDQNEFYKIVKNIENHGVTCLIEPTLRYAGKTGEQWTVFFLDPSNNPIEIKCYTEQSEVFK